MHKELDKSASSCVWGNAKAKRGVHLLDWDSLCKPKEIGGANLKSAKEMNQALMSKLT